MAASGQVTRIGYRRLRFETFESRQLLAADLGVDGDAMDVNGDGDVSAVDALAIINQMNRHRLGESSMPTEMDINGDGRVSAADVLQIINRIAVRLLGSRPPGLGPDFRSIDGTGNNLLHPQWGAAGNPLLRLVEAAYSDGISQPSGDDRPSPRSISNVVVAQTASIPNSRGLSNMIWQWGQFIDHDMDHTAEGTDEALAIAVPSGDPFFDPEASGTAEINFTRSAAAPGTGDSVDNPRQQINQVTAFLDGSMVYGSDAARAAALRTFQGGRLKTSDGDLLPMNTGALPNAGGTSESMFIAGDLRANEQVGLISMHTLWVREHNRLADEIAGANPMFSDETVYQRARELVIAQIQAITFNEYLPAVLGSDAVAPYQGYQPEVRPEISNLFATAAFRYGHTQLSGELKRLNDDGTVIDAGNLALRDSFFHPDAVLAEGIDAVLMGLAADSAQEFDPYVIDDVRNFLFGPPGAGGFDLASLNIQRGRDHGLPDYNTCRDQLGMGRVESFSEITSDPELAESLEQVYGSVDKIDVWIGALAEDHLPGSSVGELLRHVISRQFEHLRDGDRYWYQRRFNGEQLARIESTRLGDVIRRNTGLTRIQDHVFFVPDFGPPLASSMQ